MLNLPTLQFLVLGSFLGLTAGISPGPLITLVITQTIKHNRVEGIKVAISPLITDLPIILATVLIFSKIAQFNTVLGIISIAGGVFVAYLGYESSTTEGLILENQDIKAQSLKKGVLANFLNPNPYLFWATIGTPYAFKAFEINMLAVVLFFVSFYGMLIGSKVTIVFIIARTREYIKQRSYILIMKLLGIALFIFSILFFYEGIKYLLSGK